MCIVHSIHKMPQLKTKMIKNISQYIKSTFKYFFLMQLCYFSYCSFTNLQRIGVNLAYIKINNLFFIPNVKLLNAFKFNLNETLLTFMLGILFHFFSRCHFMNKCVMCLSYHFSETVTNQSVLCLLSPKLLTH